MAAPSGSEDNSEVYIYDRRTTAAPEVKVSIADITSFSEFKGRLKEVLGECSNDFVIATTSREEINNDETWGYIENGDTLYILNDIKQELCAPAQERVDYLPHYDTIVKGGMYEYYASEGQNPLPYAFAELIDNSLAATAFNDGSRTIELRLFVDDSAVCKNCVVVLDNGTGMTPRQLNSWAIYRLSKFTRREKRGRKMRLRGGGETESSLRSPDESLNLADTWAPRFMNSDISYFGVGGKQAVFFIGNATRMISKPKNSKDVHELTISKEEFEKKEKNHQSIYTGFIRNRQPGDYSHISPEDEHVIKLISEEPDRESFTAVVIQGINTQHIAYLKQHFNMWTRQLAHIYHFYLHGPDGNKLRGGDDAGEVVAFNNIDIQVTMHVRGNPNPKTVDLRRINDDMQSLYAQTAAGTFDFKAYVDGSTAVEGIIRYHPFRYDRETYPADVYGCRLEPEPEDDHGYAINERPARGRRPIFEAYWNGRLIPYTLIEEFEWCSFPKKQKNIPAECYNRISGVLWTNDSFQVSTNKLTFLDLEMKLKDKNTNFVRMLNGHEKRTQIEKEFQSWLKECNEELDKQILFSGNMGQVTRPDQPKVKQSPWTKFKIVEWDNKVYEVGQMVRILRTSPPLHGTIQAFYLYGEHESDVFAMGGDIEILQEPQSLYNERRFVPLNKLDRGASALQIKKYIDEEETKLPDYLLVSWPNGQEVVQNEKRHAGKTIGDIKVEICNKRAEKISKIPFSAAGSKKLLVELKLIWHSPHGDETIVSLLSQHGKTWPYWFRKMDSAKNLGNYTLQLHAVLNESGNNMFGGKELPSHRIKFSVIEADAEKFTVGILDGPFKVGVPFQIPLEFQDRYNNSSRPPAKLKPILDADGLELSYENTQVKGNSCYIKGVVAKGIVSTSVGKNFNLKVSVPGLDQSQTLKIRLLPGPPSELVVKPESEITIENGTAPSFFVEVHDAAGNVTSGGKLTVVGKLAGAAGLPGLLADCSVTGSGNLTGKPVQIKNMNGEKTVNVSIEVQGARNIKPVERTIIVTPSNRASTLRLFYAQDSKDVEISNKDCIEKEAGSIIEGLRFEVLNEAGEALVIDEKLAGKIKVNWAPKVPKDMALKKVLPPIKVSTSVLEQKYCQASIMEGEGIELQFSVRPTACPPSQMDCQLVCDGGTAHLREPMQGVINISLKDVHGNPTPIPDSFKKALSVSCAALKTDKINIVATNHQIQVSNLIFTEMGTKEVGLKWKELKGYVRCEVLSGPPAALQVLDWLADEPVVVHNDKPMLHPLRVQLVDVDGNVCKVGDIKIQIVYSKIKIQPSPSYVKTDNSGIADFGILTIQATCGTYELQPKAAIGRSVIYGPKITLDVQPDSMRPVEIDVSYNTKHSIIAGHTLPDFIVTIKSESGKLMLTSNPDNVTMKLWKKGSSNDNIPPPKALTIRPQTGTKEEAGIFNFRKCQVPFVAGEYNVMFVYFDGTYELYSMVSTITVCPGSPASLVAIDRLSTPTVSNTKSVASRTLIKSVRLELRDEFDNPLGKGYSGKVMVQISSDVKTEETPVFTNGNSFLEFTLQNGQCLLQNLTLQENSPGKDGFEYQLRCTVTCDMIPKNKTLAPLDIPFLFYNDAKKQQQMAALSKERDALQNTIRAYKSMFETQQQLVSELRVAVHDSQKEEQTLRGELRKQNIPSNHLQSVDTVDKLISARIKDREQVLRTPRRSCLLPPIEQEPDILGKIAHLALVHQDDIARVLSWHMSADMDCVVTITTQKAKEVYQRTQTKQQVLPLDSIYRKNLPDWDKPLPHVRFRPNYKPVGNPVYARNLLEFTHDEESCKIVFGMLLGDTLILDNLDQANQYRQEIVKYTHCPTILTRSGDRIRSNGKFGGAMNKAPPVDKLKGCIFGQPLPLAYHAICTQIDTLEKYKVALVASIQAQDELQEQVNLQKLPETMHKYKECKDAEARLKGVEQKLGMGTPSRGTKQPARSSFESEPALKRPKLEPGSSPTNSSPTLTAHTPTAKSRNSIGSPSVILDPLATPSRTSLRIASMTTVVSEDGRKRLKKSS